MVKRNVEGYFNLTKFQPITTETFKQTIAIKGENRNKGDKAISKAWNDMQIHT